MDFDKEMEAALIADGEKLRALTGEDHGPWGAEGDEPQYLLIKRGLYERPNHMGYTGIRDQAGRYSLAEAEIHGEWIHESEALEFMPAAWDDLVLKHVIGQREELREQLTTARAALQRLSTFEAMTTDGWGFAHPELTARVDYARTALNRKEPTNV